MTYPLTIISDAALTSSDKQGTSTPTHRTRHNNLVADLTAVETKVGTGTSTPAANQVLRGTGAGTSAFGQVQTGDLAANAVTQAGFAQGAADATTTSTSFVDIADLSVTLTTTGGPLLVIMTLPAQINIASVLMSFGVKLDSGSTFATEALSKASSGAEDVITFLHYFTGVSAGSHTVTGRWAADAGGHTLKSLSTLRKLLVIELKR
jgi:hypothetical protein